MIPPKRMNPLAYPTGPGFVRRFGYGRVNARTAVDAILAGAIPPQVEIESPKWFQVLGKRDGNVPIKGRIALRNGGVGAGKDQFDYVVGGRRCRSKGEWKSSLVPSCGRRTSKDRLGSFRRRTSRFKIRSFRQMIKLAARRCGPRPCADGAGAGNAAISGPAAQWARRGSATHGPHRQ